MRPIAKSAERQVRSTELSHIVNTTIRLSRNAVSSVTTDSNDNSDSSDSSDISDQKILFHQKKIHNKKKNCQKNFTN